MLTIFVIVFKHNVGKITLLVAVDVVAYVNFQERLVQHLRENAVVMMVILAV
jgi:hypothetical protein